MKFVLFYHSLVSDWNHGNAHFLRGVVSELLARGHEVDVYEPADGWSLHHLRAEQGDTAIEEYHAAFPELRSRPYDLAQIDLEQALEGADVIIVHEWNEPELIARVGECAARLHSKVFFHDTHHRSVTESTAMATLDLREYHGVLAFGEAIADRYLTCAWAQRAWVWHEAADLRRFHPQPRPGARDGDVVWIGNWGDGERSAELMQFLIEPVGKLQLQATVHGVRYPQHAVDMLHRARIHFAGWLANHKVPGVFAAHGCTIHVPRQVYAAELRGVPTIRMFEALSCGIPLISAPWSDDEGLFRCNVDYLVADDGRQMKQHLRSVLNDQELAGSLLAHGLETIRRRHSCAHRVDELLQIVAQLGVPSRTLPPPTVTIGGAAIGGQA